MPPTTGGFFVVQTERLQLLRLRPRPNRLPAKTSSGPRKAVRLDIFFPTVDQGKSLRQLKGRAHDAELHANVGTQDATSNHLAIGWIGQIEVVRVLMGTGYTVAECQVTSVENRQADGAECCTYKQVCRPSSVEPRGGARDRIIVWLESIRLASRACGNYTDIDVQEYVRWRCS